MASVQTDSSSHEIRSSEMTDPNRLPCHTVQIYYTVSISINQNVISVLAYMKCDMLVCLLCVICVQVMKCKSTRWSETGGVYCVCVCVCWLACISLLRGSASYGEWVGGRALRVVDKCCKDFYVSAFEWLSFTVQKNHFGTMSESQKDGLEKVNVKSFSEVSFMAISITFQA